MRSSILDARLATLPSGLFEPFRGKTVVITGATGLIGSLVCRALLWADSAYRLGTSVIAVVRDEAKAREILGDYEVEGCLEFYVADLSLPQELDIPSVDYVLHAAMVTKSRTMVERPVDVIDTSLNGTRSMLNLSCRTGARMVYVSSMEVYGTLPVDEIADERTLGWLDLASIRACYPESKRMCEILCNCFASQFGVEVCSARLAQTFGAGVLPGEGRAFAQFARAALAGEEIVLRTRGLSEGNYVNSVDVTAGLLLLLACGEPGEAYNIANEESHGTICEVAELTASILGDGKSRVVIDVDESNLSGYAPDVHLRLSSAKLRALGWETTLGLTASLQELANCFAEQG